MQTSPDPIFSATSNEHKCSTLHTYLLCLRPAARCIGLFFNETLKTCQVQLEHNCFSSEHLLSCYVLVLGENQC